MIQMPNPGQRVHYVPAHGGHENGIVKKMHPTNESIAFVVYKCNGEWQRYEDFTAESTDLSDLHFGWL